MTNAQAITHTRAAVFSTSKKTAIATPIHRLVERSRPAYVLAAFAEQVAVRADHAAVQCGAATLSYGELDRRSNRLAHLLKASGVGAEDLVGIHLERTLELPVAMLAVLKAGAAFLPLDPKLPAGRIQQLVAEGQPALVLTTAGAMEAFAASDVQLLCLDRAGAALAQQSSEQPATVVVAEQLAYVIFTSGSTGRPKGVEVCHHNLENYLRSMAKCPGLQVGERSLALATIAFDMSILDFWLPITVGAEIVLGEADLARDVKRLHARLQQGDIALLHATPTTLRMLIEAGWQGDGKLTVLSGGEAMNRELADAVLARARVLYNGYGPTETTVCATLERVAAEGPISIGRAIHHVTTYVLDEQQQPVATGEVGELWIGGRGVSRGYLRRPSLTAERFVPDPFTSTPGARMYRTGDAVRLGEDGRLLFIGRLDDQVKIRGHRIELGEVEAAMMAVPEVSGAVVTVHGDAGTEALAGYYCGQQAPSAAQLRTALKAQLPAYMIPATLDRLAELPRSSSGKVDRRALPVPAQTTQPCATSTGALSNDLEREVAAAFTAVLGVGPLGADDDFFDLGGSSLLAVRVQRHLERALAREISLSTLFEHGGVRALATALSLAADTHEPEVVAIQPQGGERPVFCLFGVRHYWPLAQALGDLERPFYGLHLEQEEAAFYAEGASAGERAQQLLRMAARYAERIVSLQPEGPYTLVGHSTAGVVAFETAQVLRAQGHQVENVILLDTVLAGGVRRSLCQALRFQARRTRRGLKRRALGVAMKLAPLAARYWTAARVARQFEPWAGFVHQQQHLRAYEEAELHWEQRLACPYDGDVTFVHALARTEPCGAVEAHAGWAPLVLGAVNVLAVRSAHREMMREPGVGELAASLRPYLATSAHCPEHIARKAAHDEASADAAPSCSGGAGPLLQAASAAGDLS